MNAFDPTAASSAPRSTSTASDPAGLPGAVRRDRITHTLRGLEPWIAGAIALYTAWMAALVLPGLPLLWPFVAYAGLIATWCAVRPAHHQLEVFLRGASLVAGAAVLQMGVVSGTDVAEGQFFFWLSITSLHYAFILKPLWGIGLVALAVLGSVGPSLQLGTLRWASAAAPLGFLAIFPLMLAMRFGAAMRRSAEAAKFSLLDRATELYSMDGLLRHGQDLVDRCAREHKPVSMVVLDCSDLREIRTVYGRETARRVLARVVRKLNAMTGERGFSARTSPTIFCVLLPGLTREEAYPLIERFLGHPARIECDGSGSERVIVPNFLVDPVRPGQGALAKAHAQACRDLLKIRQDEENRQRYLTRERESHSHPAPLQAAAVPAPSRRVRVAQAPAAPTIPVPLARAG